MPVLTRVFLSLFQATTATAATAAAGDNGHARRPGRHGRQRRGRRSRGQPGPAAAPRHAGLPDAGRGRAPLLALLALALPHRQALPAPLLLEVLQHSPHTPHRRSQRHASLLCQ